MLCCIWESEAEVCNEMFISKLVLIYECVYISHCPLRRNKAEGTVEGDSSEEITKP